MRSSKSRTRSKANRNNNANRSMGNVTNRVFDSSGPEGKVRGTPQQIIEKYNQLARDAQLSGDRVASENFQQHAEHYLRLLGAAQKEIDARREEQERQNRERQAERDRERDRQPQNSGRAERDETEQGGQGGQASQAGQSSQGNEHGRAARRSDPTVPGAGDQPDLPAFIAAPLEVSDSDGDDSGLVETPESRPRRDDAGPGDAAPRDKPARQPRKPRAPRAAAGQPSGDTDAGSTAGADASSDAAAAKPARQPRKPRRAAGSTEGSTEGSREGSSPDAPAASETSQ